MSKNIDLKDYTLDNWKLPPIDYLIPVEKIPEYFKILKEIQEKIDLNLNKNSQ